VLKNNEYKMSKIIKIIKLKMVVKLIRIGLPLMKHFEMFHDYLQILKVNYILI